VDERDRFRRALLIILVAFVLLLYCLGAVGLWARKQFLGSEGFTSPPTLPPVLLLFERMH
jgi:hypothetical protein